MAHLRTHHTLLVDKVLWPIHNKAFLSFKCVIYPPQCVRRPADGWTQLLAVLTSIFYALFCSNLDTEKLSGEWVSLDLISLFCMSVSLTFSLSLSLSPSLTPSTGELDNFSVEGVSFSVSFFITNSHLSMQMRCSTFFVLTFKTDLPYHHLNCTTVWKHPCVKCYVGKTNRALKSRIAEHCSIIRCKNLNSPVAVHFTQFNHLVSSLKYLAIEKVSFPPRGGNLDTLLARREHFWISNLQTRTPHGLNIDYDLWCFL